MKELPVLFNRKEECCGCTACYAICPQNAISMQVDEEGFDYPIINALKCIRCYCCINVCSFNSSQQYEGSIGMNASDGT